MRYLVSIGLIVAWSGAGIGQGSAERVPPRFGIEADLDKYPQKTFKDTLRSVLKAIDEQKINYLMAHLGDPAHVDKLVKDHGGRFDLVVKETTEKLAANSETVKELRRFLAEGEWSESGETATAKHKDIKGRQVFLRKIGSRWFLEDRKEVKAK